MKNDTNRIEIVKADDFHLHLRQGNILLNSLDECSRFFSRGLIMPNIIPPVTAPEKLLKYQGEIKEASPDFTPLMTFKIINSLTEDKIRSLKKAGAVAGKFYPSGSTTNSSDGIKNWRDIRPVFKTMSEEKLVLSIHGEDPTVFILDREKAFIQQIMEISEEFPDLRIVFEHLSTKEAVSFVKNGSSNLAATITVQHLLMTLDDVAADSLHPHNYCKPILKRPEDRDSIQEVVLSGNRKFFFGSDSAPHLIIDKEGSKGNAGCYSSPVALPRITQFFDQHNKLDLLENFVSKYGADFYGLSYNREKIILMKNSWTVPEDYSGIKPLFSGETIEWNVEI